MVEKTWEGGRLTPSAVTEWKNGYWYEIVQALWSPLWLIATLSSMLNNFPFLLSHFPSPRLFFLSIPVPFILLCVPSVMFYSQRDEQWVGCWRASRPMRAFRWMAAASQKKMRTAAAHTTTKALKVRHNSGYLLQQCFRKQVDSVMLWNIKCDVCFFPHAVPNCVLTKELLTDGLKVLISKEDELLYAARVHTLEIPDM